MRTSVPDNFDREKPFYPLVANYVVQLAALKELFVRRFIGPLDLEEIVEKAAARHGAPDPNESERVLLREQLKTLIGPLQLRSEFQDSAITVDIDAMAAEFADNAVYLLQHQLKAAGSVLVMAHECSKDKPWHGTDPLWEFLRHCRNAAGHGGSFSFKNDEPRRAAVWGRFEIVRDLQGTPLFKRPDGSGMLSLGDPIRLLWDIEQAFPDMSAGPQTPR